ncbi:MAG: hypothetical protein U0W65_02130 [Bacteroidia bacterium]
MSKKAELNTRIEKVILKIIERRKHYPMGINGMTAQYAYDVGQMELHIKELKQQIHATREGMVYVYGEEIISEIEALPVPFRKVKRFKISGVEF